MSLRLTPWILALLGLPLVGVAVGLALHPALWHAVGPRRGTPAMGLITLAVIGLVGWLASHSDAVREHLSTSRWHRFHLVQSSPQQGALIVSLMRWTSVAALWGAAILSILGKR